MQALATDKIRTAAEVEHLCRNWRNDPCWDLETAEGFEAHAPELLEYRLGYEAERAQRRDTRLAAKADALGVPGNLKLAAYIEELEHEIATLKDTILNGY